MDKQAPLSSSVDLIVIGAGPAGLSGAATAAGLGLSVILLDEQPTAGGQVFRGLKDANPDLKAILGPDYTRGAALLEQALRVGVRHIPNAVVWRLELDGTVVFSVNGAANTLHANRILVASGALERAMPLPGWTLPGVMTIGAAQILLKQSFMVPKNAVLAGSGPLLYLFASQMIRAGTPPIAIVETQTKADMRSAMRFFPKALRDWRTLLKGLKLLAVIRQAGIPRFKSAKDLEITGTEKATGLQFYAAGTVHKIRCGLVLLHQGVVANTQISRALELPHVWSDQQHCFHVTTDDWGAASGTLVHFAGDGAGIVGADAAAAQGDLAALDIAHQLGYLNRAARDRSALPKRKKLMRAIAARRFLDQAFAPSAQALHPADDTVICRCEEVTAGDVRAFAKQGEIGPNQIKTFTRCGMGPCQGRFCGLLVTQILAASLGKSAGDVGCFRIRYPIKPVSLKELASLDEDAG